MEVVRLLSLAAVSFIVSLALTPVVTNFLYKHRRTLGKQIRDEKEAPTFHRLHKAKAGTPTMGGVLIWGTSAIVIGVVWFLAQVTSLPFFDQLDVIDRGQTYLPLAALLIAAAVGLIDDFFGVLGKGSGSGGIRVRTKLILYTLIAAIGAWWFFHKLEWDLLYIPFFGNYEVGIWYIPIFIFMITATGFSANETDGLDGLLGGVSFFSLGALAAVSAAQGRFHLAAFLAIIMGALLAFLWFNIYPARFFMGDTGAMALGVTIGVVAMLTNSALFLPFFAFIFVMESVSVLVQVSSKKFLGKKFLLSSPIHHHFEAVGWPEPKVVMRFWIISAVMAAIGLMLYFASITITGV